VRQKAYRVFLILTLTSVLLLSPNCATLIRNRTQRIPVTSSPVGATVSVNGRLQGVTPVEVRLPRTKKGQVIRIECSGFNPVEICLKRDPSEMSLLGDLCLGFIIGVPLTIWIPTRVHSVTELIDAYEDDHRGALIAVPFLFGALTDVLSGYIYDLSPADLAVTLTKVDGPTRVDRILIDADDFRNVKWIRVRRD